MPTTVNIAGRECKLPSIDTLTMDEAEILWEYGQVTIGDLIQNEGAAILRPTVLRAFLHIALVRADPAVKPDEIAAALGSVRLSDIFDALGEDDADDPPSEAADSPPPQSPSTGGSGSSTSDDPDSPQPATGHPDSETSASSVRLTSVR